MSELEMTNYWHNFATGQMEACAGFPQTDEEARKYIPQYSAAQGLYRRYRDMGKSIAEAMAEVLLAVAEAQE